jgi:hypothetical protein
MNNFIKDYDTFVSEGFTSPMGSTYNTPGMGNVTASGTKTSFSDVADSADQDKSRKHLDPAFEGDDSWMRPNGNSANRNWLIPNYNEFQDLKQSMTRFQIGQSVKCVNANHESCGLSGKIIAFEDATIRWEVSNSETGVGQTSQQYRCLPSDLDHI